MLLGEINARISNIATTVGRLGEAGCENALLHIRQCERKIEKLYYLHHMKPALRTVMLSEFVTGLCLHLWILETAWAPKLNYAS